MRKYLTACLLILLTAVLVRYAALEQPINRDIAAYAEIGARLVQGELPYRDYFDHKQPLVYPVFWLIALVAPRSNAAVQLAAALVAGIAGVLVFLLLTHRLGYWRSLTAGLLVVVLGAAGFVQGTDLNTEHLLLPFAAAAVLLPLRVGRNASLPAAALAGILGGLAVLAKAVGLFMLPAALLALALPLRSDRVRLVQVLCAYFAGLAAPLIAVVVLYAFAGGLDRLLYDNLTFNALYVRSVPPPSRLAYALNYGGPAVAALVVFALIVATVRLRRDRHDTLTWVLVVWLLGAVVGAKLGLRDYAHYFAPILPPAILLACLPVQWGNPRLDRILAPGALVVLGVLSLPFLIQVALTLGTTPNAQAFQLYGPQSLVWTRQQEVGEWLQAHAAPGDRLFVAGSEPGIYWMSGLDPATMFLYDSPHTIIPGMDQMLACALATKPPRFLVIPTARTYPYLENVLSAYQQIAAFDPVRVFEWKGALDTPADCADQLLR